MKSCKCAAEGSADPSPRPSSARAQYKFHRLKVGLHANSILHPFRFTNVNAIILMSLTCFFIAFYA